MRELIEKSELSKKWVSVLSQHIWHRVTSSHMSWVSHEARGLTHTRELSEKSEWVKSEWVCWVSTSEINSRPTYELSHVSHMLSPSARVNGSLSHPNVSSTLTLDQGAWQTAIHCRRILCIVIISPHTNSCCRRPCVFVCCDCKRSVMRDNTTAESILHVCVHACALYALLCAYAWGLQRKQKEKKEEGGGGRPSACCSRQSASAGYRKSADTCCPPTCQNSSASLPLVARCCRSLWYPHRCQHT